MKNNWEIKTLGEMCDIKPPKSEARSQLKSTDLVSFVPMEDLGILSKTFSTPKERKLQDVSGSYTYFAEDDVLLAKITPCFENGKLGIAKNLKNGVGFGSSEFIVFRTKQDILPDYLFYVLSSDNFREEGKKVMSGAVGHKRVPKEYVENYKILIPPISEQRRIVKILDEKFGVIEELKKIAEQQIKDARELFESRLNEVFENPPKEWTKCFLEDVALVTMGQSPIGSTYNDKGEGLPLINGPVEFGKEQLSETHITKYTSKPTKICGRGDLLICVRGSTTGRTNIAGQKACLGRGVASISPIEDKINKTLLHIYIASLRNQIYKMGTGATFPNVSSDQLKKIRLAIPPKEQQNKIGQELDELSQKTKGLEVIFRRKIADLEELKKSYLEQAFSGNL